jgi:hypothetical protein
VAGVWLIVSRLPEFGVSLVAPLWSPDGSVPWFVLVHLGVVIGCGLGLLFLRHRIAAWLVPMPQPDLRASVSGLQAAAFAVVGRAPKDSAAKPDTSPAADLEDQGLIGGGELDGPHDGFRVPLFLFLAVAFAFQVIHEKREFDLRDARILRGPQQYGQDGSNGERAQLG